MLNIFVSANQMPITNAILRKYQNTSWVILNHCDSERNIVLRRKILKMLRTKRETKDRSIILILLFSLIFGVDKLRISKR